jgi:TonB family protein
MVMTDYTREQKDPRLSPLLITLALHVLIILFLYLFQIHVPNPPFPPDSGGSIGIEVRLGTDDAGSGTLTDAATAASKAKPVPTTPDDNNVVVNNTDESISLKHTEKKKNKKVADKPVEEVKTPSPQPSSDLAKALTNWDNNNKKVGGGHGSSDKQGNEGDPNGTPNGKGSGTPGDGPGGNGPGGNSTGPGGPGTGAHLKNRHLVVPATLVSNQQEEGRVVVNITVDKDGNVISAEPTAKGSSTTNSVLWALARQAALKMKFDQNPAGNGNQKGTYVFDFSLK